MINLLLQNVWKQMILKFNQLKLIAYFIRRNFQVTFWLSEEHIDFSFILFLADILLHFCISLLAKNAKIFAFFASICLAKNANISRKKLDILKKRKFREKYRMYKYKWNRNLSASLIDELTQKISIDLRTTLRHHDISTFRIFAKRFVRWKKRYRCASKFPLIEERLTVNYVYIPFYYPLM